MVDVYKRKGDWKLLVTFLVTDLLYLAIRTNEDQSVMAGEEEESALAFVLHSHDKSCNG